MNCYIKKQVFQNPKIFQVDFQTIKNRSQINTKLVIDAINNLNDTIKVNDKNNISNQFEKLIKEMEAQQTAIKELLSDQSKAQKRILDEIKKVNSKKDK